MGPSSRPLTTDEARTRLGREIGIVGLLRWGGAIWSSVAWQCDRLEAGASLLKNLIGFAAAARTGIPSSSRVGQAHVRCCCFRRAREGLGLGLSSLFAGRSVGSMASARRCRKTLHRRAGCRGSVDPRHATSPLVPPAAAGRRATAVAARSAVLSTLEEPRRPRRGHSRPGSITHREN